MTRTETQLARLQEAAQYFPVYTRPIPGELDESQPLRRGCFACQHTGKSSLHGDHRFATVWFHAVNAGNKDAPNLIQPLGAVVVDLMDKASAAAQNNSIVPFLREANTTFPKLWIYYMTTSTFQKLESPYVRLIADRTGHIDHINSRISLWNNLLTEKEQANKPTDITLTIQGNWGKGVYLDPGIRPKGLLVSPEELIAVNKKQQSKLLESLQGAQQLTRIAPLNEKKPNKKKVVSPTTSYLSSLQKQAYQAVTQNAAPGSMWNVTYTNPWDNGPEEVDMEDDELI